MSTSVNMSEVVFLAPLKWRNGLTYGGKTDLFLVGPHTSLRDIDLEEVHEYRLSEPLNESELFKRFSKLKTDDEILEFANQFGFLGLHRFKPQESEEDYFLSLPIRERQLLEPGERLSLWQSQIKSMYDCLELWKALQTNDLKFLETVTKTVENMGNIWFHSPSSGEWEIIDPIDATLFNKGDSFDRAAAVLSSLIWGNLHGQAVPYLTWRKSNLGPVFALRQLTSSLKGVLWLRLSEAIATNTEVRLCKSPTCGNWFSVGGGRRNTKKKDAEYCSRTCAQKTRRLTQKG
jgi:hypothetical protein